jgi:hypothetical protein
VRSAAGSAAAVDSPVECGATEVFFGGYIRFRAILMIVKYRYILTAIVYPNVFA